MKNLEHSKIKSAKNVTKKALIYRQERYPTTYLEKSIKNDNINNNNNNNNNNNSNNNNNNNNNKTDN